MLNRPALVSGLAPSADWQIFLHVARATANCNIFKLEGYIWQREGLNAVMSLASAEATAASVPRHRFKAAGV